MNFGDGFVVRFADDGKNGGKRKVFDNFFTSERHDVGRIKHRSLPDDVEIKLVTSENASQAAGRPLRQLKTLLLIYQATEGC